MTKRKQPENNKSTTQTSTTRKKYTPLNIDDIDFQIRRKPKAGQSFADHYPHLVQEWNDERNKGFKPDQFFPKSSIRVWWKCCSCLS